MANPFPGMNPYLEDPAFWPGFHSALINAIADALNSVLPAGFAADVEERLYIAHDISGRGLVADVLVSSRREFSSTLPVKTTNSRSGATAVLTAPEEKPVVVWDEPHEVREPFVTVLSLADDGRVVSTIELLSPSNKTAGGVGRQKYRSRRETLLNGDAHFLEIDLLRGGAHTLAVQRDALQAAHAGLPFDYSACLHRAGDGNRWETWTRTLHNALPHNLLVPLIANQPDIDFDLQTLVDQIYAARRYADRIDYREEPLVPFSSRDAEWANDLLRQKSLR